MCVYAITFSKEMTLWQLGRIFCSSFQQTVDWRRRQYNLSISDLFSYPLRFQHKTSIRLQI